MKLEALWTSGLQYRSKGNKGLLADCSALCHPDTEFIKALGTTSFLGSGVVLTMGIAEVANIRTLDILVRRKSY